ncbi:MAG: hypothetical protein KDI13_07630 [Alphaproteobacteria bacterium]|nr:hypothetical protein [Alphaproteobacteria bacterium]
MANEPTGGNTENNDDAIAQKREEERKQEELTLAALKEPALRADDNEPAVMAGLKQSELGVSAPSVKTPEPPNGNDAQSFKNDDDARNDPYSGEDIAAQRKKIYDDSLSGAADGKYAGVAEGNIREKITNEREKEAKDRAFLYNLDTWEALWEDFQKYDQEVEETIQEGHDCLASIDDAYNEVMQNAMQAGTDYANEFQKLQTMKDDLDAAKANGASAEEIQALQDKIDQQQKVVDMKRTMYEAQGEPLEKLQTLRQETSAKIEELRSKRQELKEKLDNAKTDEERAQIKQELKENREQLASVKNEFQSAVDQAASMQKASDKMLAASADNKLTTSELMAIKEEFKGNTQAMAMLEKAAAYTTVTDNAGNILTAEQTAELWACEAPPEWLNGPASETAALTTAKTDLQTATANTVTIGDPGFSAIVSQNADGQYVLNYTDGSGELKTSLVQNEPNSAEIMAQIQSQLASGKTLADTTTLAALQKVANAEKTITTTQTTAESPALNQTTLPGEEQKVLAKIELELAQIGQSGGTLTTEQLNKYKQELVAAGLSPERMNGMMAENNIKEPATTLSPTLNVTAPDAGGQTINTYLPFIGAYMTKTPIAAPNPQPVASSQPPSYGSVIDDPIFQKYNDPNNLDTSYNQQATYSGNAVIASFDKAQQPTTDQPAPGTAGLTMEQQQALELQRQQQLALQQQQELLRQQQASNTPQPQQTGTV